MPADRFQWRRALALAWLLVALALTLTYGAHLGFRGWIWLGVHHLLCLLGVTHELLLRPRSLRAAEASDRPAEPRDRSSA